MEKHSLWQADMRPVTGRALKGSINTDVLIIGAGMAGILTAYRLQSAGIRCIVAEGDKIGGGVTQNTTAKVTAQHGMIYDRLIKKAGLENAQRYLALNRRALEEFRLLAQSNPCDMEEKTAYVYTMDDRRGLDAEAEAYARLGLQARLEESPPIPLQTRGALGMVGQLQLHPLKLLYALAEKLTVYEGAFIKTIEGTTAYTDAGSITARRIVFATHFPLVNIPGLYFMKLYQHRSYVVALENGPQLNGMYVDECDTGHSFRNYGAYLLIGGGDHKTGKRGGGYEELHALAARAYPDRHIVREWATQDCMTLDGLPYIGLHRGSRKHLYVATGFNKWGMSGSMAAALLLEGLIVHGKSEYADLFSPQRSMLHKQLLTNLGSAAANLLRPGRRCPHMGCALRWNAWERTWDCPCHGSRFAEDGHVRDNPAKKGIRGN